jgi:HD superfamily phosphohydrolase
MAVENILFSKYLMYKSVYWHKGVRTTSSIVKKALTLALEDGVLNAEELYPMDDRSFGVNLDQRDYAPLKNILKAETPWVFRTLYEETFDEQNFFHQRLKDRKTRHSIEKEIAGELSKVAGVKVPYHQVSIDVPRAISMEAGLPIILEHKTVPFSESGTVFDPMVVSGFTRNLKKIRLIGPAELESLPAETLMKIFHA